MSGLGETTENAYLGGQISICQPARGYRAGVDPVLLAAATPARSGQSVLELGCGVGTAILCLGRRVPGLSLTGVELQQDYAALAQQNGAQNTLPLEVITADLVALPKDLRQRQFDHVIANPPYFDRSAGNRSEDAGRETAMGEATPLTTWVEVAAKRLAPKGLLTMIHRVERLQDLLAALPKTLGSVEVQPLQPRQGRDAHLILLRAKNGGRSPFRLHAPITLHARDRHVDDSEDYSELIRAVLRDGASLPF